MMRKSLSPPTRAGQAQVARFRRVERPLPVMSRTDEAGDLAGSHGALLPDNGRRIAVFKTIVVGHDGSIHGDRALELARRLAAEHDARLVIAHVTEWIGGK